MRKSILILLMAGAATVLYAQTGSNSKEWIIKESRRLYTDGEYNTALNILDKIDTKSLSPTEKQEIELLRATATYATNHLEGRALLLQYLADHPETSRKDVITALIGESYYYSHNFDLANKWFKEADLSRLEIKDRERAELHYALTLQECGEEQMARNLLTNLAFTGKEYAEDAQFHLATIQYHNNELQQAYEGLKKVEMSDKYHLEVPYYLAGIYVKQEKFAQAQGVAEAFIADHSNTPRGTAMQQMLGAALFGQGKYADAIEPLENYIDTTPADKQQRIAIYQLALSHFETGNKEKAKSLFEKCCNTKDVVSQNSLLHLGIINLEEGKNDVARMNFEQAANMGYDNKLREEALYNYALSLHQTRHSPFAESVKVFEQFLNDFPQSAHCDQVNKYLAEIYMNTRNYEIALQSINKISAPSPLILESKQKILYRLGVQEYINGNMDKAIEYFDQSLTLSQYNKATKEEALYWRAESYYNKGNYATAAKDYKSVIAIGGEEATKAIYGLAYTYFQQGKMQEAERNFSRFVTSTYPNEMELCADAYNRIADCYFYNRNYTKAEEYYEKSASIDKGSSDYALYRNAISLGLRKKYDEKVTILNKLVTEYPNSSYAQQGYYEMGRAYIEMNENQKAIETFDKIKTIYPQSDLARRSAAEKAMILNSDGNHEEAIKVYKEIIAKYPNSEEAQIASQDLKNLYIEQGDIDGYTQFISKTKGTQAIKSSEIDTLSFIAAEKIYGRGDTKEAEKKFEEYIKKFPTGAFSTDSRYYLGFINYNKHNYDEAIKHFETVTAIPSSKYCEEAMAYASEIYSNNGEWEKAARMYKEIIARSNNKERLIASHFNLLRCTYNMNDNKEAIAMAQEVKKLSLSPEQMCEAEYYLAKALLAEKNDEEAEKSLKKLASDTRTIYGAEAKFLLSQLLYEQKRYKECEEEIFEYMEESTPHAYWLARSFVLLSDLYTAQERYLEAKQYLLSLQNNYNGNDEIKKLIEERLKNLKEKN